MADEIDLTGVASAASELQRFCATRDWKFCFIGGIAVQAWALPRATVDADITLLTGFGGEEMFVDEMLAHFQPRYLNGRDFALRNRVLLLWSSNRCGLDIGLGALPFEENSIERSDWADVDTILMRQGGKLDADLIFRELEPLVELKEEPAILEKLRMLMRKRLVL